MAMRTERSTLVAEKAAGGGEPLPTQAGCCQVIPAASAADPPILAAGYVFQWANITNAVPFALDEIVA
jgi:hypothetical protein